MLQRNDASTSSTQAISFTSRGNIMEKMEKKERRRFTRLHLKQEAVLQLGQNSHQVQAITNLSIGGCLLEITGPFSAGEKCSLIIPLHHMAPNLEIDGEIIRSGPHQTTICFTSVSPENLLHLQNIIRYNADDPDKIEDEIQNHPGLL